MLNPVKVELHLEAKGSHTAVGPIDHPARRLLDAEKVMFRTDEHGDIWLRGSKVNAKAVEVVFVAQRLVMHRDGPAGAPRVLHYDIVLEESYFGIPRSALPIILTAAVLILAVVLLTPLWSDRAVPAIVRWLGEEGRPQKAAAAADKRQQ
ncbi:hypothetical protein N2152v2_002228 [Parachlorella kessleri]